MIFRSIILANTDINGPNARKYSDRDTIYVSPSGKDGYLGYSEKLPVRTLNKAKLLVNKLKVGDDKNINVEFLPGNYSASDFFFSDNKLTFFKHNEGGDDNYSLTFKPKIKNSVIFDNSTTYKGFEEVGDLWRIKIEQKDIRKCNMFGFVNETRSVPARFPKYGNLSEYTRATYEGISYAKVKDSTGFLNACVAYLSGGGSNQRLGYMRTEDFRTFTQSYINSIETNPLGTVFEPDIFYISGPASGSLQFFANQSTIVIPSSGIASNSYEPSNLDPYIVCSVRGENTVIKEGDDYYFYYYPSNSDLLIGSTSSVLETFDAGHPQSWWISGDPRWNFSFGSYQFANKTVAGYSYNFNPSQSQSPVIGFNIISPKNVKFEDLNFKYCISPLTLNNPSSAFSVGTADVSAFMSEFTHNISITGCRLYNTFGSGMMIRFVSDSLIYKNLIYSTEGSGIRYTCGHNIVIDNNIIKGSQQVDTRHNGDFGSCVGNLHIHGDFINNGHRSQVLSGVRISNNDLSYAGNNLKFDVGQELSAFNNKIYNAGFGANSDMAGLYSGFSFQTNTYNHYYKNLIYNARASSNNNFLGNVMYFDGVTTNCKIYDNILANGQTGIQLTPTTKTNVTNNIIYDMKYCGITLKNASSVLPISLSLDRNIFVTASSYVGITDPKAFIGWNANGVAVRPVYNSPYYAEIIGVSGITTATPRPTNAWKSKLRYSSIARGGIGTLTSPVILFNGNNWVIGDVGFGAGDANVTYRLSSENTSQYQYPWEVPDSSWINLNNSTSNIYTTFSGVRRSNSRRSNSDGNGLTSDYNLFWSLNTEPETPESDISFFKYSNPINNDMSFVKISSYATIPDPQKLDDNSVTSVLGDFNIIERNSKLSDPMFYDVANFDFSVDLESPALDLGFTNIDTSNIGVYNTDDDLYWKLSASQLKAQPVINGHKDWSDYKTIPFPYITLVEYDAPQHE